MTVAYFFCPLYAFIFLPLKPSVMQNQRNMGYPNFRSGNRFPNDNFDGNNGNERSYQDRHVPNRYDRGNGYRSSEEDQDDYSDDSSYNRNQRYGNFSNSRQDDGGRNGYSSRGYEENFEDVARNHDRYNSERNGSGRNYGSQHNQQGDRPNGSNGRGYNELSGGRNDQYDRDRNDDWNRNDWESDRDGYSGSDRNSNNGYNSFDRYADRGNYNTSRNGGGGYGSTSNRYEDPFLRNNQSGRYGSDMYGSYNNGNSDWQNGQRQRNSRRGFGAMSAERRGSFNTQGGRESQNNR
jgi:hypothetical protein